MQGIQGQAGLGASYQLSNRWQLGIESAATYIYGKGLGYPDLIDPYFRYAFPVPSTVGGEFIFNPINALWLTYSFGKTQ